LLRIQRALLVELLVMLVLTLSVLTAIIFGGLALNLLARVGEGVGTTLLLGLMPSLLPTAMVYSLPFAWLVTVSMVVGRWVNDHEVTSLRSAGVHLRVLVRPTVALSAVLGVVGMGIAVYVVPAAQRDVNEAKRDYLPVFLGSLKDMGRSVTLGNGRFSFDRFQDGAFLDVELERRDGEGRIQTKVMARRLALDQIHLQGEGAGLNIHVSDGYVLQSAPAGETRLTPATGAVFDMAEVKAIGGSTEFNTFFGLRRYMPRARDMDLEGLMYADERGGVWRSPRQQVAVALHGRLSLGCAAVSMGLFALGMTLLLPPSGRRVRDFLAAFLPATLIFFPLLIASPGLAAALPSAPWLAMWAPGLAVGLAALVLIVLAYRR
jgi:lipopolysaccharide export LptBFGC system permease protein LptF